MQSIIFLVSCECNFSLSEFMRNGSFLNSFKVSEFLEFCYHSCNIPGGVCVCVSENTKSVFSYDREATNIATTFESILINIRFGINSAFGSVPLPIIDTLTKKKGWCIICHFGVRGSEKLVDHILLL